MKKILLVSGVTMLAIVVTYFVVNIDSGYTQEESVVPETVSLYLDNNPKPVLVLRVSAGGGCDKVSDLHISETKKEGTLFVTIEGYSIQKYQGSGVCSAVVAQAVSEIDLNEFLQFGGHQVWFTMGNMESRYSLSQAKYALYLEPIEVTNVISREMGANESPEPQSIALITDSKQFAVLSLNGTYRSGISYTEHLRNVASENNLVPVDEVLKGFVQGEQNLWVLADESQIPTAIPALIGKITYDSGGWGMESVDVAITRNQPPYQYSF